jgi:aminobenzoyl-glutamate utilization protein A
MLTFPHVNININKGGIEVNERIAELAAQVGPQVIATYRDIHRYPEPGWTEFRTASIVIKKLQELGGWEVKYGAEVVNEEAMMGVPPAEILAEKQQQAIKQGADPEIVAKLAGGKTGVVAILDTGKPGPTVGFRVDMDANDMEEAQDEKHRPFREGFASVNPGAMHACGHDSHTAMGLGLAEVLLGIKDELKGKVKIIFQPAEEGVRGAKSMAQAGVVDDVDYMIGIHIGGEACRVGHIICGVKGYLATTKMDAIFTGVPAHAGGEPEAGKNALLAAATAVLNLYAISRHSGGSTRINVGTLVAGTGRNVIPPKAVMKLEVRGSTTEINDFVEANARRILAAAAAMHDVELEVKDMGGALGCEISEPLAEKIAAIANGVPGCDQVQLYSLGSGSEDYSYFASRVQELGGQATFMRIGTELAAGHHNSYFDINEASLPLGVKLLGEIAYQVSTT